MRETVGELQIATEYWERVRRGKMKGRDRIKRRRGQGRNEEERRAARDKK
jgi:hypothetical protein